MATLKMNSLWGEEIIQPMESNIKSIKDKIKNPKKVKTRTAEQMIRSKSVSIEQKMESIRAEVYRILGHYADNIICIRDLVTLHNYIDSAIANGIISIDTETNNSLEPITCKLVGPCIYTPGQKYAYIPINHYNKDTGELLPNQLTEADIKREFDRLGDTKILMHNAVFDYKVIHCTCECDLDCYWDTRVAAKMLDENESASLKDQFILHINPEQDKYNIEKLFQGLEYAIFEPELFALYAAPDAYMTYALYEWQKTRFEDPDLVDVYNVFMNIEMPMNIVIADMELKGIGVDIEYAKKLSEFYHTKIADYDRAVDDELAKLKPDIDRWRNSEDASQKVGAKTKGQQLKDPVELTSPTQLSILLYDVMKVPVVDKKDPRGTDKNILKELAEVYEYPICRAILDQREFRKLLDTFIDKMPSLVIPKTGRLHARFDAQGTVTGRLSSNSPRPQL